MKKNAVRITILVLLVVSTVLALGPCLIKEVAYTDKMSGFILFDSSRSIWPFGVNFSGDNTSPYLPQFFGIITFVEAILLLLKNKILRGAGIVLDIFKAVAPALMLNLEIVREFGGERYHIYYPSVLGYALYFLCFVTVILYVVDMANQNQ